MTNAKNIIAPTLLGTVAATLYATPGQTSCVIKKLTFANVSAAAVTVTVYLMPSGSTAADATTIRKARSVAVGECYDCTEAVNHVLQPGGAIQALCSAAAAITVIGSGIEIR